MALVGRFPALAGVDLDVAHGEILLLSGPNGAGKTSLLRLCAGLLAVERGSAVVLGHDLTTDRRSVRRRIGFVGHATALYDDLTVRDNVRFWARAAGATAADGDAAMDRMAIPPRLHDVPVHRLSAGQRRRTSIAAVVARRPELWLLDEPHAGLDVDARDLLDGLVRDAVAGGATAIIASHELERARGLADRGVTVVGGTVGVEAAGASGGATAADGPCHEAGPFGASPDDAVDVA